MKWRGNSYLNDTHKGRLLNYGWFDAGGAWSLPTSHVCLTVVGISTRGVMIPYEDHPRMHAGHLKLMFPMGWTIATLAWGILDGYQLLAKQTYDGQTNLAWGLETLEYGLEFLLDCSFDDGEFVAQVC